MQPRADSQAEHRRAEIGRGDRRGGERRGGALYFVALVALAALLRLAYTLASRQSPFFDHLDLDTKFYDSWARQIAAGDWVGRDVFFMGPLYPYFLALIYKVFGPSLLAAKIVQSLVGALTAGFTFLLGRECLGKAVGILAGLFAAVYVPFIFTDTLLLFPVLATLLNTIMLYLLLSGLARGAARAFVASGFFAGLSAAGNASILAFAPLAVAFILLWRRWALEARLRKALLFVAGLALVVVPIAARNYAVGRDFVPLTSNAGLNFYIGNSAKATGAYVKPDGLDIYTDPSGEAIAERALGRQLKPSQVSSYWTDRALGYITQDPGAFVRNLARKFFFFWSVYEIPQIEHLPFERQYSRILRLPTPSFGMICPLGVLGAVLALRRRRAAHLLLFFVIAYAASIIAFFVVARYRLPAVPALMVFAAYAVLWLIGCAARGRWRHFAYAFAGFLALFALVHINFYRIHPLNGFAQSHYRLGVIYEGKSDLVRAIENHRKAVELDPTIAAAHVNLGILLSRQGKYDEAKAHLGEAVRRDPAYDKALYNLGLVYAETGRGDSALVMLDRALEVNRDYALAKLAKAGTYYEIADLAGAESLLFVLRDDQRLPQASRAQATTLLGLLPQRRAWLATRDREYQGLADRWLLRGDNLASLGLAARSLEAYLRAIETDSLSTAARFQAGTLYANLGDLARARMQFDRVLEISPSYKGAHFAKGVLAYQARDIAAACEEFKRELVVDPTSSNSHINLAMCYEEHLKDFAQAAHHLRRYIDLTGGTEELKDHLKELEGKVVGTE